MGRKICDLAPKSRDFLMKFTETEFEGLWLIEPEMKSDERGSFGRTFCVSEFNEHDLWSDFPQWSTSSNLKRGTVRGMHFQKDPKPETKLIRCTRGKIFDVAVDLRPDSKTYLKWFSQELSESNRLAMYIPAGFAHGFQTLEDNSEILYAISEYFEAGLAAGVRHDDPKIQVKWPLPISMIYPKDNQWPLL
jgi:dTDP-4-dehydrorhamnose 3,5-epimerase